MRTTTNQIHAMLVSRHVAGEQEWRELILRGGLLTALSVERPDSELLNGLHQYWSGEQALQQMKSAHEKAQHLHDLPALSDDEILRFRTQACRLIAAAGLVGTLQHEPENLDAIDLWLSAGLGKDFTNLKQIQRRQDDYPASNLSPRQRLLSYLEDSDDADLVRTASLNLLGVEPIRKVSNIPIAFVCKTTGEGVRGQLELRQYGNGSGRLIGDPSVFKVYDPEWEQAFADTWAHLSHEFEGYDVVWRLSCASLHVHDRSAQAALECGLKLLKLRLSWPQGICVSASVNSVEDQRRISEVGGIVGEGNMHGPKVKLAVNEGLKLITFEGAKSLEHDSVIPMASVEEILEFLCRQPGLESTSHRNAGISDHDWYRVFNFHSPSHKKLTTDWLNDWVNHDEVLVLKGREDSGRKYLLRSALMTDSKEDYSYLYFPPLDGCEFPVNIGAFAEKWFAARGWKDTNQGERLIAKLASNFRPSQDFCLVLASLVHHAKRIRDVEKCIDQLLKQLPPDRNELSLLTKYFDWAAKKRQVIIHVDDTWGLNSATLSRLLHGTSLSSDCKLAISVSDDEHSDDICQGFMYQEIEIETLGTDRELGECLLTIFKPESAVEVYPILWEASNCSRYELGKFCTWLYEEVAIEQTETGWEICQSPETVETLVSGIGKRILAKLDDASRLNPNFRRFLGIASCFETAIPFKLVTSAMNLDEAESEELEDFLDDEICESGFGWLVSQGYEEPGFYQIATYRFKNQFVKKVIRKLIRSEHPTAENLVGVLENEKRIAPFTKTKLIVSLAKHGMRSSQASHLTNELKWYVSEIDADILQERLVEKLNAGFIKSESLLAWVKANARNGTPYTCYAAVQAIEASQPGISLESHGELLFFKAVIEFDMQRFQFALDSITNFLSLNSLPPEGRATGLLLQANCLFHVGNFEGSMRSADQSLGVFEQVTPKSTLDCARCFLIKGKNLISLERNEEALNCIDKCLQTFGKVTKENVDYYCDGLVDKSRVLREMSRYDEALVFADLGLAIIEQTTGDKTKGYAFSLVPKVEALVSLLRFDEALNCVEQSLLILEQTMGTNTKEYAEGLSTKKQISAMKYYSDRARESESESAFSLILSDIGRYLGPGSRDKELGPILNSQDALAEAENLYLQDRFNEALQSVDKWLQILIQEQISGKRPKSGYTLGLELRARILNRLNGCDDKP